MSPENQWLEEDGFPIDIVPFEGIFRVVYHFLTFRPNVGFPKVDVCFP